MSRKGEDVFIKPGDRCYLKKYKIVAMQRICTIMEKIYMYIVALICIDLEHAMQENIYKRSIMIGSKQILMIKNAKDQLRKISVQLHNDELFVNNDGLG